MTSWRLALLGGTAVLALGACAVAPAPAAQAPSSAASSSAASSSAASSAPADSATPDPMSPGSTSPAPATPSPSTPAATSASPSSTPSARSAVAGILASGLVERPAPASVRVGTFALGDSFLLGSKRTLTAAHVRVDAEVGRQFYEGIPELRAVVRSGTLPRNVVVHLGTNGFLTSKHCDSMVATAGPARRIFFVTVIGPRSWMAPNDRVLKACAARHHQQVVVVDWAAVSAPHPNWFGPDRVHPNPTGRKHYNALILAALREYAV